MIKTLNLIWRKWKAKRFYYLRLSVLESQNESFDVDIETIRRSVLRDTRKQYKLPDWKP